MGRVLFHIDLNAFFASAEVLRNCALEDKPLVVSGLSRRGVVCTASYAARAYGVRSAMPIQQAMQLCPDLVIMPCDFAWYETCSQRFFDFIRKFTPYVEPASIDECYADVTDIISKYKRPLDLAWQIQQGLYNEIGLTCSIGVAPNRFLAKMASDMKKPMGITILRRQEVNKKLWPLPIEEMWGIGKKTSPILKQQGILTIGDLANPENENMAMKILGRSGYHRIQNARGYDSNQLCFNNTIQSLSQSTTLDQDVTDYAIVEATFRELAQNLSRRLKAERVLGKTISISIRYFDFTTIVRSSTLDKPINAEADLLENAYLLFDKNNIEDVPIRHLGISLGSLVSSDRIIQQISMFEKEAPTKQDVLKELNDQLLEGQLMFASDLLKKKNES